MSKYYKTNKPEILQAESEFSTAVQNMVKKWKMWAAQFDGKAAFQNDSDGVRAGYLKLNKHHLSHINGWWSKPSSGFSYPVALSNKRVLDKEKQKLLIEQFSSTQPEIKEISRENFNSSLGINSGDLFFANLYYFVHDSYIYFRTSANIKNCEEILGSEYEKAESDKNANYLIECSQ